jgi:ubiquitin C-terminal hydrolase
MTPYIVSEEQKQNGPVLYDLYAVSNHYGSLSFGHYTAYCYNPVAGEWYDFNDSSVSSLNSKNEAISSAAYVLYYRRKDFFPDNNIDFEGIRIRPDDDESLA